jgi:hypothetical protein
MRVNREFDCLPKAVEYADEHTLPRTLVYASGVVHFQ